MMNRHPASEQYRQSLKSMDTEEGIDLAFYRPIGYAWARLAARCGISPNAITIASIFLGVAGGICFYFTDLWIDLAGMLLIVWANSFDSADGQLARMTHQYSRLGRVLDGLSGDFWFAAIYISIALRTVATVPYFSAHPWAIWVIIAAAAICHAKQAAMADYYRQFHLYFLKGEEGSELDNSADLSRRLAATRGLWSRLVMRIYLNYTRQQEATSPSMQRLRRALKARWPDGAAPARFRAAFRRQSLPLMKYTNILSFNWRIIILFASILAGIPWLYPVAELTAFNGLLIYMIARHERLCRRLAAEVQAGDFDE